jgi:alanine racemase
MTRATRAIIHLSALQHNLRIAQQSAGKAKVMAIIKANAYGHGLIPVANALDNADAFGVATLAEAIQLRHAGIRKPITLLEGFTRQEELPVIAQQQLDVVIHHSLQVTLLEQYQGKPIPLTWVKIDTGMHRLGFNPADVAEMRARLSRVQVVQQPLRWFTHLANADERTDQSTVTQLAVFHSTLQELTKDATVITSVANSAGILAWPASHGDWVRPGIMLYGVSPFTDSSAATHNLKPVMTLQSSLLAINQRRRGDRIGYGGSYVCPEDMAVGVVAIGYGDGYPRHAKAGTPVLVNGQRVPLIGRVSMDMIMVDLRSQPQANIGDPVVLWGQGLAVEEIARSADTIGYQLLCGVTTRVPYEYI